MVCDIHLKDCLKGMEEMDEKVVDVVVTSPPYNLGIKYNTYGDAASRGKYLYWMRTWAKSVRRVLASQGSIFLNMGGKPSSPMGPFEVLDEMTEVFELQNTVHWIKSVHVDSESYGHFKPINSRRYLNDCHEYIFHLTRFGDVEDVELDRMAVGVPYKDKTNVERWSGKRDIRCRGNTWFIPYKTIRKRREHPAVFPVELPEMCIKLHGVDRAGLVMDPFMGIGNTALACKRLGKSFVGYEIDEKYLAEANRRLGIE